jgi:hypothetical protein
MAGEPIAVRPGLPRPVSHDELAAAVAEQRSWRGVMRTLGFTTSRTGRVLRAVCDEVGIDYAHFRQSRVDLRPLPNVVESSKTWEEVLGRLGYAAGSGSARATVRKHCRRLGVDTSHLVVDANQGSPHWRGFVRDTRHLRAAAPHLVAASLASVGIPVSHAAEGLAYDLLADLGSDGIARIQVKSTTQRVGETWECSVTRNRYTAGVSCGHRKSLYSAEDVDFFACVDPGGGIYLIPIAAVEGLTTITLRRYKQYRLGPVCACETAATRRADSVVAKDIRTSRTRNLHVGPMPMS